MKKSPRSWMFLFSMTAVSLADGASAASLSSASSTAFTVPNGSFETPALPASPGYQYAPAGSGWTLVNGAGLSRDATAFTSANPSAPQGAQVLFLQGGGSASRTLNFPAGYYLFSFSAAQRGNPVNTQRVELRIDGASIQGFTPSGTAYQRFSSDAVLLSSGAHSIELRGLNPQGGDNTAFVDELQATRVRDIGLSGFESPVLPTSPGYAYAPAGGPWSFNGLSGLSRNASGFTASNPAAPEGSQVLFLQGASSASTAVSIPRGGYYRFRLKAALRANNPVQPPAKNIRLTLGGTQVGEFRLASTQYVEQSSAAIYLDAGVNTVSLVGVDTSAGDHTGLVDDLRMEMLHDWQDPYVWGGAVPGVNDDATVSAGSAVCLQGTLTPKSITVSGELLGVQNRNVAVATKYVMVMGSGSRLELGQELTPYPGSATFTLNATPADPEVMGMGSKFIGAMGSGTIHLHGLERVSWTQLGANVNAGSSTVVLKEAVDWQPGDKIVIVSSHRDWNEAEQRTIASVFSGNTALTLDSPLAYSHTGVVKSYSHGSRTWTADLRAQVGLLSHNILVQGDASSASSGGFGGHVMIMDNSVAYVSGVELFNMGQKARLGRYPFHWHMLGSGGSGQYFKNSSVHHSYNRAITIHGTESTLVENNFFHDHIGHGVFLEDGSERFNVIKKNVTLLTRRPAPGEELTPSDNQFDQVQNRSPASYWITNPQNTFEDNVAAGTEGTGFWFALPSRPMGLSANDPRFSSMRPNTLPMISFKGNSAHSTMSGFDIFDGLDANHSILPNAGWSDTATHLIENGTWYANDLALYTGIGAGGPSDNLLFRNNVLVENVVGTMLASYSIVDQSVFVANSGENLLGGTRYAYRVYDGAGQVRDSHFIGWDAANANFLINTGAAIKHPNHLFTGNTMSPASPPRTVLEDFDLRPAPGTHANHPGHPRYWSIVLRDVTGGISGKANTSIVSNHPFMRVGDEYRPPNWERTYRSDHRFVLSRLAYNVPFEQTPNITCTREKAGLAPVSVFYIEDTGYHEWHQLPFLVNEGFEYTYAYESLPTVKAVTMNMEDATAGDNYIAHFKDFGKLGGLSLSSSQSSFTAHSSLASLRGSTTSGYYLQPGGDLSLKAVATGRNQSFTLSWSTDFVVPPLDTDGDQLTDSVEINSSRQPFDAADLGAEFVTPGGFEGWTAFGNITGQAVSGGVLTGISSNNGDAQIVNSAYHFNASRVPALQVRMRASQNTGVQIFFATSSQPGFSGTRVANASYTGNGAWQTLTFDMAGQADWTGTITDLRLDPVSGVGIPFDIDSIRGPGM
ncbi:G8 domain-containing protein [Archangium gephyra]|uniref:G8 domain-containing protein n=2 Tax=Archangium gephyra TaxID=48 RepID=A0ABX9K705_9BACT|nr:G8 domain-containing protein [Archangium gephyra]REG34604.1 G8 domain-containing protein [Archangium gephyra]